MKTSWDKIFDPHSLAPLTPEEEEQSWQELFCASRENEALLAAPEHQRVMHKIEEQLRRAERAE